jgi:CheY-like chemotaxis protein
LFAGRKLLVADDSPYYRTVISLTFTDEGMEVATARDSPEALGELEQFTPDIILANVSLPGIGGYQLCEWIKQSERFGHIPVMLLVGLHEPFDQAEARRVGADDFVTKPFKSIRQLVSRVGSLLGGKPADAPGSGHSTLGLERSDIAPESDPEPTVMDDTNVKVFVEASSMTEAEPIEPAVEGAGGTCEADIERQTANTQKLEMPEAARDTSDDANVRVFLEAPSMTEHEPGEPAAEAGGSTCAAEVELQTANTQKLERIDDEPENALEPIAYAQADTLEMKPLAQTNGKFDTPADVGVDQNQLSVGASEMNEEAISGRAPYGQPVLNDALLDLGDFNSSTRPAVAEDLVLDLEYEEPASAAEFQATEPVLESASADEAAAPLEGWAPETALLAAEPTHEEQHVAELQEWEFVTESPVAETITDSVVAEQESIEPGLKLSPETIDAIARRAVAHLSEKVVREIAWEVVPELAELLIKKKLEEQK